MNGILRIASFNLENLDDKPGQQPDLSARIPVLRPQIEQLRADILCLQEVNGQHIAGHTSRRLNALTALLDGTPYQHYHRTVSKSARHGPMDVHNLVVLSRFPVLETRQYQNDLVAAPLFHTVSAKPPVSDARPVVWDRPILFVRLDIGNGQALNLFNVHYRAPLAAFIPGQKSDPFAWKSMAGWAEGYYLASMKRSGQALETRLAMEDCFERDEKALICVAGDFNAGPEEMPVRIVLGREEDTGNAALAGRSLISTELSLPEDRRFTVIHSGKRQMLDHILASRGLAARLIDFEAHNNSLDDEWTDAMNDVLSLSSHHAPIVAEFDLPL
jgi:endonuclease/exonuclease/phosphatase family metal-dependent hydrolase